MSYIVTTSSDKDLLYSIDIHNNDSGSTSPENDQLGMLFCDTARY